MRDLLPPILADFLRDRYIAGVARAEASFDENSADEDAVTGALGQAIAMPEPLVFTSPEGNYQIRITYRKVRGRGPGAPEKRYGSDGIFQIAVTDTLERIVRRKGLPFQSKMRWRGRNKALATQAEKMQHSTGDGLVIDFTPTGYTACSSDVVIVARGNRKEVERQKQMRPLGQLLGEDFLNCTIGTIGLFYDAETETYLNEPIAPQPFHVVTTDVAFNPTGTV